jgi:hypothetical protein
MTFIHIPENREKAKSVIYSDSILTEVFHLAENVVD